MDIPCVRRQVEKFVARNFHDSISTFSFLGKTFHENADIVIITTDGHLIEFKDKEIINSINIGKGVAQSINVIPSKSEPEFPTYIVKKDDSLIIVTPSPDGKLKILKTAMDISRIKIDDCSCSGKAVLQYWKFDDVLPVIVNLDKISSHNFDDDDTNSYKSDEDDHSNKDGEFVAFLQQKLCEMKLNRARNEEILKERRAFRQKISMHIEDDARFSEENLNSDKICTDNLEVGGVWYKFCNKKLVIGIPVRNTTKKVITIKNLFLYTPQTFSYNTFVYSSSKEPPFWQKVYKESVEASEKVTLVATCCFPDYDDDIMAVIYGCIQYECDKVYTLPLSPINVNGMDMFSDAGELDMLENNRFGNSEMLAIISCSTAIRLNIRHKANSKCDLSDFFITRLKFSKVVSNEDCEVLRHNQYPHNILHGTVIYLIKDFKVIVYSVNEMQIILLGKLMYKYLNVDSIDAFNENSKRKITDEENKLSAEKYMKQLDDLISIVMEFLDKCLLQSPDCEVVETNAKMQIDLMACGKDEFVKFWDKIKETI